MIKKVRLKGWRSHWDSEFKFAKGTNALIGVMGAGKTSLLDAICFALFGTFPSLQGRKLTLDDVIMNRPQRRERGEVEVTFEVDGNVYTVKRIIERGKGTTKAEIRKGDTLLDTGSTRTTEQVEKILKINYDLFSRAIYSEQNELDYFLTIPKGQRMKKIDSLLKIDKFEKARASTATLANRVRDNIKDKKKLIEEMEEKEDFTKIEGIKKEIEEIKKGYTQLIEERERLEKKKNECENELKEMKNTVNELKELEREKNILSGTIKHLTEEVNAIKEKFNEDEIRKRISELGEKLESKESEIEEIEKRLKETLSRESRCKLFIEQLVERIENLKPVDGKCPVCNRELTPEHKEKIIEESKNEIKKCEEELKKIKNKTKELEERKLILKKDSEEIKKSINRLEVEIKRVEELAEKEKKLEELMKKREEIEKKVKERKGKVDEERIEKLQKELQELSALCSELRVKAENSERILKEREEQLKELEERKKVFETYKKQIKKMEKILENLKKLERALKETQITLRKEFVDTVNFTMSSIWEYLYPYQDLTDIRLSIKEGDYILELKDSEGNWVPVEGIASGGERTTACLALRIAFALVLAPNLRWLVLDEPTHNLDSQAVEYLADVLRTKVGEFVDQVFLITHDEKLENAVTGYLYRLERKREKNEPTQVVLVTSPED